MLTSFWVMSLPDLSNKTLWSIPRSPTRAFGLVATVTLTGAPGFVSLTLVLILTCKRKFVQLKNLFNQAILEQDKNTKIFLNISIQYIVLTYWSSECSRDIEIHSICYNFIIFRSDIKYNNPGFRGHFVRNRYRESVSLDIGNINSTCYYNISSSQDLNLKKEILKLLNHFNIY